MNLSHIPHTAPCSILKMNRTAIPPACKIALTKRPTILIMIRYVLIFIRFTFCLQDLEYNRRSLRQQLHRKELNRGKLLDIDLKPYQVQNCDTILHQGIVRPHSMHIQRKKWRE